MNSKLFKKLNEQVEINKVKRSTTQKTLTEEERKEIENKVIFENANGERIDILNFEKSVK